MPDTRIDLDAARLGLAVLKLSKMQENPTARTIITKIVRAWDPMYGPVRNDRRYCSVRLAAHEAEVYRSLAIKSLLQCTYAAVYVDPKDPTTEVKVCSEKRPPKRATFNVRGGKRRLTRMSITRITPEENHTMARKPKNESADDLDGLDDLDLDGDDEDEDEAPAVKPKTKAKAKTETPAEKRRRIKAEKAAEEAEEEDEDDEDEDEEDEEDEEEDEPAPAAKSKSKSKASTSKAKSKGSAVGRALPEGKFGVEQVAALAGTSGRAVRIYCRANEVEKAEGLGRYAWTEKQATALAKKIKAGK